MGASLWALEALFPSRCVLCARGVLAPRARAFSRAFPLCPDCESALERRGGEYCPRCGQSRVGEPCPRCARIPYSFDSTDSSLPYSGEARRLLVAYKFHAERRLAAYFASLISPALMGHGDVEWIIPVPPRPGKKRRVGWDQTEDLARALSRAAGIPLRRALIRRDSRAQKELDYQGRLEHMRGAILPCEAIHGVCAIVDDVFTTGATVSECARVLKEAGATLVRAFTIAQD
jgi:competence protein ComFC